MRDTDKHAFADIYRGVCATYGREANKDAMRMAWALLARFELADVQQAYAAHVARSKFMPTPAEILDLIGSANPAMRRPGADEAWAMMPRSEDDSVVWTEEMAAAWAVASSLVNPFVTDRPDWVAARMAFKDAYQRAVESARAQGRPVAWTIARGQRKDNLEDVLTEAMRLGHITPEQARPHLRELEHVRPVNQQLLLEGAKQTPAEVREAALAAVARLKGLLTTPPPEHDLEAARADCDARDRALTQPQQQGAA